MMLHKKRNILDMFLDRTAGEAYSYGRLVTRETDSGTVALIAYGWLKIAEYNESRDVVTVFTGHTDLESSTVNGYLNDVVDRAEERGREVNATGESPKWDQPNDGTRFINSYVGFDGNRSDVEKKAVQLVRDSLSHLV